MKSQVSNVQQCGASTMCKRHCDVMTIMLNTHHFINIFSHKISKIARFRDLILKGNLSIPKTSAIHCTNINSLMNG